MLLRLSTTSFLFNALSRHCLQFVQSRGVNGRLCKKKDHENHIGLTFFKMTGNFIHSLGIGLSLVFAGIKVELDYPPQAALLEGL